MNFLRFEKSKIYVLNDHQIRHIYIYLSYKNSLFGLILFSMFIIQINNICNLEKNRYWIVE